MHITAGQVRPPLEIAEYEEAYTGKPGFQSGLDARVVPNSALCPQGRKFLSRWKDFAMGASVFTMKCTTQGCSHQAHTECSEYSRGFCDKHVERCDLCHALVCVECRDEHESSPLHDEDSRRG
jgi:hypothetical protein